jgi:hypothetical protein
VGHELELEPCSAVLYIVRLWNIVGHELGQEPCIANWLGGKNQDGNPNDKILISEPFGWLLVFWNGCLPDKALQRSYTRIRSA